MLEKSSHGFIRVSLVGSQKEEIDVGGDYRMPRGWLLTNFTFPKNVLVLVIFLIVGIRHHNQGKL